MSNCGCVYVNIGEECFSGSNTKKTFAAHEIECCECDRTIDIGETYAKTLAWYDPKKQPESPLRYDMCLDCASIRDVFFCEGYLYRGMYELLEKHIEENNVEISSDCLARLTKDARNRVCDMIEEWWGKNYYEEDD